MSHLIELASLFLLSTCTVQYSTGPPSRGSKKFIQSSTSYCCVLLQQSVVFCAGNFTDYGQWPVHAYSELYLRLDLGPEGSALDEDLLSGKTLFCLFKAAQTPSFALAVRRSGG